MSMASCEINVMSVRDPVYVNTPGNDFIARSVEEQVSASMEDGELTAFPAVDLAYAIIKSNDITAESATTSYVKLLHARSKATSSQALQVYNAT